METKPVLVAFWWDRRTKQWIVTAHDAEGHQVGPCGYAPYREAMEMEAKWMADQYKLPHTAIVKWSEKLTATGE